MLRFQNARTQPERRSERRTSRLLRDLLFVGVLATSATAFAVVTDDRRTDDPPPERATTAANAQVGSLLTTGSILSSTRPNSRFANSGSYAKDGSIVGLNPNGANSRFAAPTNSFRSKSVPELLSARNEYYRALQEARPDLFQQQERPRLVTATPPKTFAYRAPGTPAYGRSRAAAPAAQDPRAVAPSVAPPVEASVPAVAQTAPVWESAPSDPIRNLQQLWMRGPAPRRAQPLPAQSGFFDYSRYERQTPYDDYAEAPYEYENQGYFEPVAQALGGGLVPETPAQTPVLTPPAPSPAQLAAQFQEYLETILLQSPDVNPLGPIQVDYYDGVVTLRGVVPTPSARLAAGKLVLADPRVDRVNNLLAYLREDVPENGIGEKIEIRPSQPQTNADAKDGAQGRASGQAAPANPTK